MRHRGYLAWRIAAVVAAAAVAGSAFQLALIAWQAASQPDASLSQAAPPLIAGVIAALALTLGLALPGCTFVVRRVRNEVESLATRARQIARVGAPDRFDADDGSGIADLESAVNDMAQALGAQLTATEAERARLAAILATMADGVIMVDPTGRIVLINAAAAELLGTTPLQAEERSLVDVARDYELASAARECHRGAIPHPRLIELGQPPRHVQVLATPLPAGVPGRNHALLVLQDVSELRRADTVRREFVANVSHELRTPVAGLKALAETLDAGALEDPQAARGFLKRMLVESDRLAQLVEELLELARLEAGRAPTEQEPIDLGALVARTAERLRPLADQRKVTLIVEPEPGLPVVAGDPVRLERALVNLVDNGIKFTPAGGQVRVGCRQSDGDVVVSVADTGAGIPADDLPRVFERFYKADRARTSEGTGLGLAIAKHTVQAQGGRIWAESVEGKGSTFFFSLPLRRSML